ncbi:hypothetical protein [Tropicimonas sp. S265A]|uniref:hypothetical protein n=1 Tax=Tropicimonas sp. S265A TaxID=3415134 RepID=UPI003C7A39AD
MVTDIGAGEPVSLLETATDQVSYLRRRLHTAITKLEDIAKTGAGDRISRTDLQRQLKDLREATSMAMREETRFAEECRKLSGELQPGYYDTAAAELEVRGRLARLRKARTDG